MFKKIFAGFICVMMLVSFIPFTVSAAESADFKICVAAQDEKSVTITFDFIGGTGFSALDANIDYNNLKLTLEDCQFASGFASFKEYIESEGGMTIFNANSKDDPIKISIATTVPFKKVNSDGAILKMKFSKIAGVNVSDDDISLSIENCQNSDFTDIKANISYDFSTGSSSSSSDSTVEGGKLPEESAGQSTTGASSVENSAVVIKTDSSKKSEEQASKADSKNQEDKTENAKTEENKQPETKKTVAFFAAAALFVAGVIALGVIILKNRKLSSGSED